MDIMSAYGVCHHLNDREDTLMVTMEHCADVLLKFNLRPLVIFPIDKGIVIERMDNNTFGANEVNEIMRSVKSFLGKNLP